jgi:hypothetical protein
MKTGLVSVLIMLVTYGGCAHADCGTAGSYLNLQQLNSILVGNFACGRSTSIDPPGWNERHTGGTTGGNPTSGPLIEQHEGGSTVENVGTWSTSNSAGRGRILYSYSGGTSDTYEVAVTGATCGAGCTTLAQTYSFCGVGGSAQAKLSIYVSTTFQAPSSPGVMNTNCPTNP